MSLSLCLKTISIFGLCLSQAWAQSSLEGFSSGRYEIHKNNKPGIQTNNTKKPVSQKNPTEQMNSNMPSSFAAKNSEFDNNISNRLQPTKNPMNSSAKNPGDRGPSSATVGASVHATGDSAGNSSGDVSGIAGSDSFGKPAGESFGDSAALDSNSATVQAPLKSPNKSKINSGDASDAQHLEPSILEQTESLFTNDTNRILEYYRQRIEAEDIRKNKVEIEFSPLLVYNDSTSNYSFRTYQSFFEAMKVRTNIWLTPLVGLKGQIMFSIGSDIEAVNHSRVPTHYENIDLSFNLRNFFGPNKDANSLEYSLIYSENALKTASDSTLHPRIASKGFGLGIKARIPSSESFAWAFGAEFFPRLVHTESATSVDVNSGSSDQNVKIGLDFGTEWIFSRKSILLFNIGLTTERNTFNGSANLPDSSTGLTPTNVSATNSFYSLNLGYRWGH